MSGHSVTVKRADEVVVGDWINFAGSAHEVTGWSHGYTSTYIYMRNDNYPMGDVNAYLPGDLVEVMDK